MIGVATSAHESVIYLSSGDVTTFCVAHDADTDATDLGVLFCAPFGWDDIASYRSRRSWATQLSAAGHLVLRFDLPGSGDSAGSPAEPARLDAWCAAVVDGETWLRAAGCKRVAVIGLGIGGLLALRALDLGASFEDLVLWGTPGNGRAAVRELRAFSSVQSHKLAGAEQALPEGWLEVGGYVLSAITSTELQALDPVGLSAPTLRRILALEREGSPADARLADMLSRHGATVTRAPGPGYAAMVSHPQSSTDPVEVFATTAAWLAEPGVAPRADRAEDLPRAPHTHELRMQDAGFREVPVAIPHRDATLQGVLATPTEETSSGLGAIFFNAGALRRTGPNRLWVESCRSWAAAGVPALRLDLGGIGDSGEPYGLLPTRRLYSPEYIAQARAALEWMLRRPQVERVMVVGLCSGGHVAFHLAASDDRVCAAVLANVTALFWDGDDVPPEPPGPRWLLRPERLRRSRGAARGLPRDLARWAGVTIRRERSFRRIRRSIERQLDRTRASGTRVVLALNEREPEQLRLGVPRHRVRLRRWPNIEHVPLPGTDHALRPIPAQRRMRQVLDEALSRELARLRDAAVGAAEPRSRK